MCKKGDKQCQAEKAKAEAASTSTSTSANKGATAAKKNETDAALAQPCDDQLAGEFGFGVTDERHHHGPFVGVMAWSGKRD